MGISPFESDTAEYIASEGTLLLESVRGVQEKGMIYVNFHRIQIRILK